ncbi:MAG TPA: glycosyltransferase family 2 protein [Gaiellaceae bacterium]|jgi:glycosyltransferase involved in cell wall biosynthesis
MTVKAISIIAPMLNEAVHVECFVTDIAAQDFEGDVDVIVADGGSTDGSRDRLEAAARRHGVRLTVLRNPQRWVSHALNACIREARGDLIVRLDCHSRYPSDYLRRCASAAEETGALVVGGVIVAEGRTPFERAVACAMDTPFGGIGFYRIFTGDRGLLGRIAGVFGVRRAGDGDRPTRVESDTLTFGAFSPDAFRRVGLFDESLRRNQDDEFNLRVRRSGGRVVLDPAIRVHYRPRGTFAGLFRQYFEYGLWKVPVMLKHGQAPSPRSIAPSVFVSSLLVLAPAVPRSRVARLALTVDLGSYAACAAAFGTATILGRRESWRLLPRIVAVFPTFHVAYGLGMLHGCVRAAIAGRPRDRAARG